MTEEELVARTPPHSLEAEESLLGAMIQNSHAVAEAMSKVRPTDFYSDRNRLLYQALIAMADKNIPVNVETALTYLREHKLLESIIGNDISYLERLVDTTPITRNAGYYAEVVSKKALLREVIGATDAIRELCYMKNGEVDEKDIVDQAEKTFFDATKRRLDNNFTGIDTLIVDAMAELERRKNRESGISGVPSGFTKLDEITGGFQKGDLVIIAARPSMGKTSFVLNIAENVATTDTSKHFGVAIFSLEMSKGQIAERLISSKSGVELSAIRKGFLKTNDWIKIGTSVNVLFSSAILVDDSNPLTIMELKGKARQMQTRFKEKATVEGVPVELGLVIIDYLQLLTAETNKRNDNRAQEVAEISRGLKALAKELGVPVLALSQLNRGLEQREDKRPKLSDLRESGSIEQDADLVLFLHREKYFSRDGNEEKTANDRKAEVIIGKHRNGPLGEIELEFVEETTRFMNPSAVQTRY